MGAAALRILSENKYFCLQKFLHHSTYLTPDQFQILFGDLHLLVNLLKVSYCFVSPECVSYLATSVHSVGLEMRVMRKFPLKFLKRFQYLKL